MAAQDPSEGLEIRLRDRILSRLDVGRTSAADYDGLAALYEAWCAHVPFDNIRKVITIRENSGKPLPGGAAADFFENWLTHGTGGTCWPSSNALYELLCSLGFHACRVIGHMRDLGIVDHASVKVVTTEGEWLVDSSMLTNQPLPLDRGIYANGDPVFSAEVEPVDGGHMIWFDSPPIPTYLPCRILPDPADHAFYLQGYEQSRELSPFNQHVYVRRNRPGELLILYGYKRFSQTRGGLASRDLSREELCRVLRDEVGISEAMIERWVQCGGLEASFDPFSGPKPLPVTQKPPSMR